jgi:hypothetical protein
MTISFDDAAQVEELLDYPGCIDAMRCERRFDPVRPQPIRSGTLSPFSINDARMIDRNVVKRAFDIAPECGSIEELKRRLIREGYTRVNAHLSGWQIRRGILGRVNRHPGDRVSRQTES